MKKLGVCNSLSNEKLINCVNKKGERLYAGWHKSVLKHVTTNNTGIVLLPQPICQLGPINNKPGAVLSQFFSPCSC